MSTDSTGRGLECPEGTPVRRWARQQALDAAVAGAPGWYAVGGLGTTNVRAAQAVFACADPDYDDEVYHIFVVHAGEGADWSIEAGPYRHADEAGRVAQQVLILAHDPDAWPSAEDLDRDDLDAAGHPVLFDAP